MKEKETKIDYDPVDIWRIMPLIVVFFIGVLLSLFIFFVEKLIHKLSKKKRANLSRFNNYKSTNRKKFKVKNRKRVNQLFEYCP